MTQGFTVRVGVTKSAAWLFATLLIVALLAHPTSAYEESSHVDGGRSTHQILMDRIPAVLEADGFDDLARYLKENIATLKAGTVHADWTLLESGNHYLDPYTGAGLPGFRSADELSRDYAFAARSAWNEGDHWKALESLGRVLHVVQDLTVPHHARLTAFDFHVEYEMWVTDHLGTINLPGVGIYDVPGGEGENPTDPTPWLLAAGFASYAKFDLVDGPNGVEGNDYRAAASELVPLAVALSAGFVRTFFDALDSRPKAINWSVPDEGRVGVPLEMSCLRCNDKGLITGYLWTLGDGRVLTGPIIHPVFERSGRYEIALTLIDVMGTQSTASGQLWILDRPAVRASAWFDASWFLVSLAVGSVLLAWAARFRRAEP